MQRADGGVLVAFEGIDGSGKTTQAALLATALGDAGETVVASKEPTAGRWGRMIRASATRGRLPPEEELEAFVADRREHVATVIGPALEQGAVVVLDRYFYSSIAYQGSRLGDVARVERIMRALAPSPDITFVLDLDPGAAMARIGARSADGPNVFERVDELAVVRAEFGALAERDPAIWVLDGAAAPAAVHGTALGLVLDEALRAKRCAASEACTGPGRSACRRPDACAWHALALALGEAARIEEGGRPVLLRAPGGRRRERR